MIDNMKTEGVSPFGQLFEGKTIDLKAVRESRGLTIEDIHKSTRIAVHILQAIEELKFEKLPESVYSKVFIKMYAKILDIDPNPLLKAYEEFLIQKAKKKTTVINGRKKGKIPKIITGKLKYLPIAALILIILGLLLYSTNQPKKESEHKETIPTEVHKSVPESKHEITQTTEQVTTQAERSTPAKLHKLTIEGKELTWIRIKEDDKKPVEMFVKSGDRIERYAREAFYLHIGNAAGVNVYINEKPLLNLGGKGQVVHIKVP
ncbi:MAG: DUF4115 domain-containing protein [Syntrophales bacterium]|nr:DUF4115 domain-containing protein [Syntrophales bacterium]